MQPRGPTDILLLGAGLAHVEVLRRFALQPQPDLRLTLINPAPEVLNPGMLPGLLRGDYHRAEAHLDLGTLAAAAGATLIMQQAGAIDLAGRSLDIAGRPGMPFDLLSLDLDIAALQLEQIAALENTLPEGARLTIIGSDGAATELALALARYFAGRLQLALVCATREPLANAPAAVRRAVRAALLDAGVELASGVEAGPLSEGRLGLSDGSFLAADMALWLTGGGGPALLAEAGLSCDLAGRPLVHATLRSVSHDFVFAAGDTSGVLLAANLRRAAHGKPLRTARPRRGEAVALDLGDGGGVAWWNRIAVTGPAVWQARRWLDRRWMRRRAVRLAAPPAAAVAATAGAPPAMPRHPAPHTLIGHNARAGATVLGLPVGQMLVQSVDCLRAPLDDPFVFGQVAAAHALAPLHATGARPWTALATATLPCRLDDPREGHALTAMLAGATQVLEADGCALVGGHHAEAAERSLGFAVSGLAEPTRLLRKGGLRPGDALLLTKPLGTGILLAAQRRGEARAVWLQAAIEAMRTSNAAAARVLRRQGATACAAVNGLGLTGHLGEMLLESRAAAVLWPEAIPALPGVLELAGADAETALLADPQSSGGLLAGVAPERAEACLIALQDAGLQAAIIGVVEMPAPDTQPIRLQRGC